MGAFEPILDNGITFEIQAEATLYYANVFNRNAVIPEVRLTSKTPHNDVEIKISYVAASGVISLPYSFLLGTLGNSPVAERDIKIDFDANLMFQIADTQSGTIQIEVLEGESVIAHASWSIQILPANYWMAGHNPQNYVALSSFVQPNHPSIRSVLDESVKDLKSRGKAPQLSGYQDLDHVDEMVESIFNSIRSLKLTYSDPPASWADAPGQKIRTPQEILDEGVGTCLDTATLFASCLEQVGLYPLLVLVPGHAFVGYWTSDSQREDMNPAFLVDSVTPLELLATFIDAGYIKLFETTSVCEPSKTSFRQAVEESNGRLENAQAFSAGAAFSFLINIARCRTAQVGSYPMPARFVEPNGTVTLTEYVPSEASADVLRDALKNKSKQTSTLKLDVPSVVKNWLDSLLDLSLRNPLINLRPRKNNINLILPPDYVGLLEDLLQDEKAFSLAPQDVYKDLDGQWWLKNYEGDRGGAKNYAEVLRVVKENFNNRIIQTNTDPKSFVTKLRSIHSEAKTFREETGSNGLYLALGTLVWRPKSSSSQLVADIESPLILLPVNLTARNRNQDFVLSLEESDVTPNFSLVEKLREDYNLNLPKLAELQTDNLGVDVDATMQYVREELIKAGLHDFRIDPKVTLGIFNFSSFRLWKDLLENWKRFERNPLVKHLIETPNEAFIEPVATPPTADLDTLIAHLPIPADSSQAAAVAKASVGHTFILQGPPGTGKSQTITNLLAYALDKGLRVLFVAEKKDALDVVKERMDATGIGAFSLDLHDRNSTSRAVRQQLDEVIDIIVSPDKTGFETALSDYEAALGPLKQYREQLHKVGNLDESIYSAKDQYLAFSGESELEVSGEFVAKLTADDKTALIAASKEMAASGNLSGTAAENPWALAGKLSKFTGEELSAISNLVLKISEAATSLRENQDVAEFLTEIQSIEDLRLLTALEITGFEKSTIEFALSDAGKEASSKILKSLNELKKMLQSYDYSLDRLMKADLSQVESLLNEAIYTNALLRGMKLGKTLKFLNLQLQAETGLSKDKLIEELDKLQKLRTRFEKVGSELESFTGLEFDEEVSISSTAAIQRIIETLEKLEKLSSLTAFSRGSNGLALRIAAISDESVRNHAVTFPGLVSDLLKALDTRPELQELWLKNLTFGARLTASIKEWGQDSKEYGLSKLISWNDLLCSAKPFYERDMQEIILPALSGVVPLRDVANSFQKGLYHGIFENLLVKNGLHAFDGSALNNYIRRIDEAHSNLRSKLPKVLASELLSRRGFDSSMKVGAIGDLILAIKQSRNSMPLRTLLSRHWDLITRITPCILASPDSAVRFIDPGFDAFDLVVFDEASQIRVANSIGALGRATAAVVVGDSQQMPPTSVAQAKFAFGKSLESEDDEEDDYLMEAESILDKCKNVRIPEIMLNWHYRSADESLIAFSNQEYYGGKLSTFPTPNLGESDKRLDFRLVKDGQYNRAADKDSDGPTGTNVAEARAIVAEVVKRVNSPDHEHESLGIVTLNKAQMALVERLLVENPDSKLTEIMKSGIGADKDGNGGTPIFVKNLETVQGSERDVILFSVAFSSKKDKPDSFPLQWGPLTGAGGHKRLNVAVTRARSAVVIFCSFDPQTLVNRNSSSRGLQDFGKYLMLASRSGATDLQALAVREDRQDRHRHEVLTALREAGFIALEEVGLSDFKVDIALVNPKFPDRAVMGILLDGPRWNKRLTVNDRDTLPVSLLKERMGWRSIERIWLPNWIRDQKGEIEKIKSSFDLLIKSTQTKSKSKDESKPPKKLTSSGPIFEKRDEADLGSQTNPLADLFEKTVMWREFGPSIIADQSYLNYIAQPQIRNAVNDIVKQLAEYEGPVSYERVGKFVASCFGFSRVVPARIDAIHGVLAKKFARDSEGFIFPLETNPVSFMDWRHSNNAKGRVAAEISITEISNAMRAICTAAGGVRFEQLVKETSLAFGIERLTKDILARFEQSVQWGVKNGRLEIAGDYINGRLS